MTFVTIAKKVDIVTGAGNLYRMGAHWAHHWFVSQENWARTDDLTIIVKSYDHFCPIVITDQTNVGFDKAENKKGITFSNWGDNHSWVRNRLYTDQLGHAKIGPSFFKRGGQGLTTQKFHIKGEKVKWMFMERDGTVKTVWEGKLPEDIKCVRVGFIGSTKPLREISVREGIM